MLTHLNQGIIF